MHHTLTAVLALLLIACTEPRIERRQAGPPRAATVFPIRAVEASERLLAGLEDALAGSRFPGFEVATSDASIFPDTAQQRLNGAGNPGLSRYAALPPQAKSLDLYLHDPLDRYWTSEYLMDGASVKFRCDFLLHLEEVDGGTRVEVVEYLPRVWARDHFQLLGRHGPGRYHDIRKVEPTVRDREELLTIVRAVLSGKSR